eukprot:12901201-Prorocentrum_lima.AAC.1
MLQVRSSACARLLCMLRGMCLPGTYLDEAKEGSPALHHVGRCCIAVYICREGHDKWEGRKG